MRDKHRPRIHAALVLRRAAALLVVALGLSALYACSLLVETGSQQCQRDADCVALGGVRCETSTHLCVFGAGSSSGASSTSSGGTACDVDGGIDGGGCYGCAPQDDAELLNACTGSACFPFDNQKRIAALADGGKLPPIPDGGP